MKLSSLLANFAPAHVEFVIKTAMMQELSEKDTCSESLNEAAYSDISELYAVLANNPDGVISTVTTKAATSVVRYLNRISHLNDTSLEALTNDILDIKDGVTPVANVKLCMKYLDEPGYVTCVNELVELKLDLISSHTITKSALRMLLCSHVVAHSKIKEGVL